MDEKAIKAVLAAYEETWNKHDMKAWGKLFTDDVDYVNRAGSWTPIISGVPPCYRSLKMGFQSV